MYVEMLFLDKFKSSLSTLNIKTSCKICQYFRQVIKYGDIQFFFNTAILLLSYIFICLNCMNVFV